MIDIVRVTQMRRRSIRKRQNENEQECDAGRTRVEKKRKASGGERESGRNTRE